MISTTIHAEPIIYGPEFSKQMEMISSHYLGEKILAELDSATGFRVTIKAPKACSELPSYDEKTKTVYIHPDARMKINIGEIKAGISENHRMLFHELV